MKRKIFLNVFDPSIILVINSGNKTIEINVEDAQKWQEEKRRRKEG